jgi:anti-sigma-K factor RskA
MTTIGIPPTGDDGMYVIEVAFASPTYRPAARQLEALFERLDEAAVRTAIALEFHRIAPHDARAVATARRQVRYRLIEDQDWPRLAGLEFGSPLRIRLSARSWRRAAAYTAAVAAALGATATGVDQADRLVRELDQLQETIQQLSEHDPDDRESRVVIRGGRGTEPPLELQRITVRPFRQP